MLTAKESRELANTKKKNYSKYKEKVYEIHEAINKAENKGEYGISFILLSKEDIHDDISTSLSNIGFMVRCTFLGGCIFFYITW